MKMNFEHLNYQPAVTWKWTGLLQEDGKRSYSLRVCKNNACPRSVWDRNTSAAINILALFLHRVQGKGRLQAFRRNNAVDEEDVMNVEAVEVE